MSKKSEKSGVACRIRLTSRILRLLLRIELSLMLLGQFLKPGGDVWALRKGVHFFAGIGHHIKEGQTDLGLAILAGHSVLSRLDECAVVVRQMQFPFSVAAQHALKLRTVGKRVVSVRVLRAGTANDPVPNVLSVHWIVRQIGAGQGRECGQNIQRAKSIGRDGACRDGRRIFDDAGAPYASVKRGSLRFSIRGFARSVAVGNPGSVV